VLLLTRAVSFRSVAAPGTWTERDLRGLSVGRSRELILQHEKNDCNDYLESYKRNVVYILYFRISKYKAVRIYFDIFVTSFIQIRDTR